MKLKHLKSLSDETSYIFCKNPRHNFAKRQWSYSPILLTKKNWILSMDSEIGLPLWGHLQSVFMRRGKFCRI